jgi:hypothetical protein
VKHEQLAELLVYKLREEFGFDAVSDIGGSSTESLINVTPEDSAEIIILVQPLEEDAEDEDW